MPHYGAAGDDALSALINLGYPRPAAQKAIDTAIERNPELAKDFETLFRAAMAAMRYGLAALSASAFSHEARERDERKRYYRRR